MATLFGPETADRSGSVMNAARATFRAASEMQALAMIVSGSGGS
jgi:hypothetical protein